MKLSDIKLWKEPKSGYSYSAYGTHSGDIFELSTGEYVSVLSIANAKGDFSIQLEGKITVKNDLDCWKILLHLGLIGKFVNELITIAKEEGASTAKEELRNWLRE